MRIEFVIENVNIFEREKQTCNQTSLKIPQKKRNATNTKGKPQEGSECV